MKVTLLNGSILSTDDKTAQQMIACGLAKAEEEPKKESKKKTTKKGK
mgnify:CR=1 FL=1